MARPRTLLDWFAVAVGLLAALVMAVLIFGIPGVVGLSAYLGWQRGYGLGCTSETLAEAPSPSRRWTARTRHLMCGGPAGGLYLEVALVPQTILPGVFRHRVVFNRDLSDTDNSRDHIEVAWTADDKLELRPAPCKVRECDIADSVDGIRVAVKPAAGP